MNLIFLSLIKAKEVFVILGGSSAANYNNYEYNGTNRNVLAYDNDWVTADSPMPGGDGELGSPWASLGNSLNLYYNQEIYFIDCARINASIIDWNKGGKYYNYGKECLDIAGNFTNRYNVLWQEGSQDNIYSYNSNYFIDTILNFVTTNSDWYISIYTYGESDRISKLDDILYLTQNYNNIYLGADIDSQCMGDAPYNQAETGNLVDLWYMKIIEKEKPLFINSIYNSCVGYRVFGDFFLILGILMIIFFLCMGCFYSREYYSRRRYYEQIFEENQSDI